MRKRSQEEVVKEVNELTNGFCGTEKLIYTGVDNKFTLVCPKHGEFKICLSKLREGCRCPKCSAENKVKTNEKLTVDQVSKRVTDKYGDKFSVDWSTYKGYRVNGLKVICPIHGEFITSAYKLVHSKNGCPKCSIDSTKHTMITQDEFINECKKVHGDDYDYSLLAYTNEQGLLNAIEEYVKGNKNGEA